MNVVLFLAMSIAALLQLTAAQYVQALGMPFNFPLVAIVLFGFFNENHRAVAFAAFAVGIFLDTYSGAPFGTITAGLLAASTVSIVFSRVLPHGHFLHFFLYATAGAVGFYSIALITMKGANFSFVIPWAQAAWAVAYNIAGMALIYGIYRWSILLKNRRSGR